MSNETAQTDQIATLTREVIRGKIADLSARERELTRMAHESYTSGRGGVPSVVPDDIRRQHSRVKTLLNGAGEALMGDLSTLDSNNDVETQLGDVKFALSILNKENVAAEAIEAARWAVEHAPAWTAKVRKMVLAITALREAVADCDAFADADGRVNLLPHMGLYYGYRGIELADFHQKDFFDLAIEEGVAKAAELKGARHAR